MYAVLAISILLFISSSHFPFSVISWPKYTNISTCSTGWPSKVMLTLGVSTFRLITMVFVFFMFIFIPKCFPSSFTLLANIWSSLSLSVVIPVSSAYLGLLILLPPINTPSSSFSITRKISSVKRLKRYGDSTHPCLVPLLILIPSEFPFSVRTTATGAPNEPKFHGCLNRLETIRNVYKS